MDRRRRASRRGRVHDASRSIPSVADEHDPFVASCRNSTCTTPRNGWRPWPEPCSYDPEWLARYRAAQTERVARLDAHAQAQLDDAADARDSLRNVERGQRRVATRCASAPSISSTSRSTARSRIRRTSTRAIDPDDRPLGSLFAFPDPFDANYGRGGLARTMTTRGWLSTWSGLSSKAKLADTMPSGARADARRAPDRRHGDPHSPSARDRRRGRKRRRHVSPRLKGAPHYLEGHRPEAWPLVAEWIRGALSLTACEQR